MEPNTYIFQVNTTCATELKSRRISLGHNFKVNLDDTSSTSNLNPVNIFYLQDLSAEVLQTGTDVALEWCDQIITLKDPPDILKASSIEDALKALSQARISEKLWKRGKLLKGILEHVPTLQGTKNIVLEILLFTVEDGTTLVDFESVVRASRERLNPPSEAVLENLWKHAEEFYKGTILPSKSTGDTPCNR